MPSVKYAISAYVADGTTTDYLITWDYLDEDHIAVYVDGTSNADPTASHTFVQLNSTTLRITDNLGNAIVSGSEIEIRRETPLTNRAITFADGSALLAADLNKNSDYLLYSMQEVLDTVDAAAQDGALAAQVATEAFRDEAEGFKNDAETAMNTTQGYLATVQSDATDADNHRIAAAASETAAATSEANAATSEANSAASETAAAASEAASLASEQAAAASEAAAAASEVAAAASQVAAAASETNAATSEANAEAAWDSFDDRYLGAKASAPTVDNDGNALLTGALYWNSTGDQMYVWNGASWDTFNSTIGIADGASSTAVTIDASGKVGIGNAAPDGNLTVGDTSTSGDVSIRIKGDATSRGFLMFGDTGGSQLGDIMYDHSTNDMRFRVNNTERMRISNNGFVGIGTTSPTSLLELQSDTDISMSASGTGQFQIDGAGYNFAIALDADAANIYTNASSRDLVLGTNEIGRLRIDGSGRVTMPYQPSFRAFSCVGGTQNGNILRYTNYYHNTGGHYSTTTGKFTAPVTGVYHFSFSYLARYAAPYYHRGLFSINGNYSTQNGDTLETQNSAYSSPSNSITVYLYAGDYVAVWLEGAESYGSEYGHFSGHLVG